jgi:hypothetical protein
MKKCFKCGVEKPLSEYYQHRQMGDGHLNKCKSCTRADVANNYSKKVVDEEWVCKERTRGRNKYRRLYTGTGKADMDRMQRWVKKYPEKRAAAITAYVNVDTPVGLERHHWSYAEKDWLDVIFLTKKDHMKAHRFIAYDQDHKMYRRRDTDELLNTKQGHEQFIKHCIENEDD